MDVLIYSIYRFKYLSTNISAGRSVECEVISDIFSCCERFKAPLNFLNFYSQDACLEEGLPTLAIRRFNSFFDLFQSKSIFLFICSTEKQKKENLRLTPPHYTFMLVTEPGFSLIFELNSRYFIREFLINSYAPCPSAALSPSFSISHLHQSWLYRRGRNDSSYLS